MGLWAAQRRRGDWKCALACVCVPVRELEYNGERKDKEKRLKTQELKAKCGEKEGRQAGEELIYRPDSRAEVLAVKSQGSQSNGHSTGFTTVSYD